jgi:hypothetical protein
VLREVQALGLPARPEARTRDLLFSIDIASEVKGRRVAIEVDGPDHYSRNALSGGQPGPGALLVDWSPEGLDQGQGQGQGCLGAGAAAGEAGGQPLVLAATLARRACLRSRGWELVTVPYFEWQRLAAGEERAAYLQRVLGLLQVAG